MQNKNVQLVLQHCCQTSWKAMLHVSSLHVQTSLATNQVVASCLNTDLWLDKITRESCCTRELPKVLATKQVCPGSVKCTTCKDFVEQLFATCINLICCKTGWFVSGKKWSSTIQTRFVAMLQVACFCCPLGDSRKYPCHTMDGLEEFWGQGGNPKAWGGRMLTIGIPKAWWGGGGRSGISTGDRHECIPWKRFWKSNISKREEG